MEEKSLEDFFKKESPSRNKRSNDDFKKTRKEKSFKKSSFRDLLIKLFSFDAYADLKDPTSVLYRRNYCIRNIVSIVNIVFILFSLVGISKSNYIVTIGFYLIMTALSITILNMLKSSKSDYNHQVVIMYLISFYVLFMSVVLYIKIYLGFVVVGEPTLSQNELLITQAAYYLMFFSLLIISLYENPKLIRTVFIWSFVIITVINLTLLHPDLYTHANSLEMLFNYCFKENTGIISDIVLRTLILLLYFLALYVNASLSHNINEKRIIEMDKRKEAETKFVDVMNSLFEAVKIFNTFNDSFTGTVYGKRIKAISKELGFSLAFDNVKMNDLIEFSSCHVEKLKELNVDKENENFDLMLEKTNLASMIIKRLELSREAEDIVYSLFNGQTIDLENHQKVDSIEEVILLSDIYDILRQKRAYKRPLNHERSIELIIHDFKDLFSNMIIIRLSKFNFEIKNAYERI